MYIKASGPCKDAQHVFKDEVRSTFHTLPRRVFLAVKNSHADALPQLFPEHTLRALPRKQVLADTPRVVLLAP